ncbi:MAG: hypothetical protein J6T50_04305, partial [Lachnospiraceae bacterium]|nr:hypothetical protein [Lachnospiraceae bacterium]
ALVTTGAPAAVRIVPEKECMMADGHDLMYLGLEVVDAEGLIVPDAEVMLKASVSGEGYLTGFGSANPITEEDYTDCDAMTYRGRAMLIVRSGYEPGTCKVEVSSGSFETMSVEFSVG